MFGEGYDPGGLCGEGAGPPEPAQPRARRSATRGTLPVAGVQPATPQGGITPRTRMVRTIRKGKPLTKESLKEGTEQGGQANLDAFEGRNQPPGTGKAMQ